MGVAHQWCIHTDRRLRVMRHRLRKMHEKMVYGGRPVATAVQSGNAIYTCHMIRAHQSAGATVQPYLFQ